ncbi:MAG: hypothetical protein WC511_01920 [Candidatus Pacearchaeota archaeon]
MNKADVLNSLQVCFPVIKPIEIWVLQDRKGHVLKLYSGKSKWNKAGHARTALHHHISSIFELQYCRGKEREYLSSADISQIIQQLLDSGDLKIVQVYP